MAESSDVPVVFADGVETIANSKEMVKFYLVRQDPGLADEEMKNSAAAQIVMSMTGFVEAALFFEETVKKFVQKGIITPERLEELRVSVKEHP